MSVPSVSSPHVVVPINEEKSNGFGTLRTSQKSYSVTVKNCNEAKVLATPALIVGLIGSVYYLYLNNWVVGGMFLATALGSICTCIRSKTWITGKKLEDIENGIAIEVSNVVAEGNVFKNTNQAQKTEIDRLARTINKLDANTQTVTREIEHVAIELGQSQSNDKEILEQFHSAKLIISAAGTDVKQLEINTDLPLKTLIKTLQQEIDILKADRQNLDVQLSSIKAERLRLETENKRLQAQTESYKTTIKEQKNGVKESVESERELLTSKTASLHSLVSREEGLLKKLIEHEEKLQKLQVRQAEIEKVIADHPDVVKLIETPETLPLFYEWMSTLPK